MSGGLSGRRREVAVIDGAEITGLDQADVTQKLRGDVGSDVGLDLKEPDGRIRSLLLHRSRVVPSTVTAFVRDGILFAKVSSFNQRTTQSLDDEIHTAREELGRSLRGIVLDLRGNSGGLLDQAISVADLFLARGPILRTKGRHPGSFQFYEAHPGESGEGLKLVVLIDGRSASAAEIVAAALEDTGRAVLVGTNSFGKGTVQTVLHMPDDAEMTLTWSRYFSPTGYPLHGLGVLPAFCTSGASYSAASPPPLPSATQVLSSGRGDGLEKLALRLQSWRRPWVEKGESGRRALRALCPAETHENSPVDSEVAAALLSDPLLFGKALAAGAPPSKRQGTGMIDAAPAVPF